MSNSLKSKKEEALGAGGKTYIWPNDNKALTYGDIKNRPDLFPFRTLLSPNYASDRCIPTGECNVFIGGSSNITVENSSSDLDKIIIREQIAKEFKVEDVFTISESHISLAATPPTERAHQIVVTSYKLVGPLKTKLDVTYTISYSDRKCPSTLVALNSPSNNTDGFTYVARLDSNEFLLPGQYHDYPSQGTGSIVFKLAETGDSITLSFDYDVNENIVIGCPGSCPRCGRQTSVKQKTDSRGNSYCECSNCGWTNKRNDEPGGRFD